MGEIYICKYKLRPICESDTWRYCVTKLIRSVHSLLVLCEIQRKYAKTNPARYTIVMYCRLEIINVLWPYSSSIGGRSWGVIVVVLCKTKIWIKNMTYIIVAVDFTSRHRPWTHENTDISPFTVHANVAQWKSCWIEISPRIVVAVVIGCFQFFKTFFPVHFPRLLRANIA